MYYSGLDADERRFLEYVITMSGEFNPVNGEARALFRAFQSAFTPCNPRRNCGIVDFEFIADLAACNWISLEYDKNQIIPWENGDHDYVIIKALRGFIKTLVNAIRTGRIDTVNNKRLFGCFELPDWFPEYAAKWNWYLEEEYKKMGEK